MNEEIVKLPAEMVRKSGFEPDLPEELKVEVPGGPVEFFSEPIGIRKVDEIAEANKIKNYGIAIRDFCTPFDPDDVKYLELYDGMTLDLGYTYRIVAANIAS
ncbi:MAG: hypothetical protein PVF58_14030 [Candidatus Methanofastidiosia archaeon]|jgi:hypothetical protein